MSVIERLEKLASEAQLRPWRTAPEGKPQDTILTDDPGQSADPSGDRAYYGGYIVGESIVRPDREFIVAVVNALPDLLRAAQTAQRLGVDEGWIWPGRVELAAALEPLFREVQP